MMKRHFLALAALIPCLHAAEFVLVGIDYTEGRARPQGTYLLAPGKDGLIALDRIPGAEHLPRVKVEEIVATLEKELPPLVGMVRVREIQAKREELAAAGKVYVLGQVKKAGEQTAGPLAACIAAAEPTEFGAVRRIQVIRKGESHLYDLSNEKDAETKLEPGDVVHVPMKMVIGR
jgi:hypothetical protein